MSQERGKHETYVYEALARPALKKFFYLLDSNYIPNCHLTSDDAERAELIYGKDVATIKGRSTQTKGQSKQHVQTVGIPLDIMEQYRDITLCVDVLFVQQMPFLHTISRHIQFKTVTALPGKGRVKAESLLKGLQPVLRLYQARGLTLLPLSVTSSLSHCGMTYYPQHCIQLL